MQERLVEHWLTSVNELTYQIPFCEVLVAKGYDVIHVSTHGRGEHGKDIVARSRRGRLVTFQLKGGDIALSDWRAIRDEVGELVQLPVRLPGASEAESHTPVLVTNGEIRGDALESIVRYRDTWRRAGYPRLLVISRRALLRRFLDAQGTFLPTGLVEFRRFVELFVADFSDRLPREKFARLLEDLLRALPTGSARKITRSLAGVAVVAGYIAEQYERAQNHVAAAEAWTICASVVLQAAEREELPPRVYEPVLHLLGLALDRNLSAFTADLLSREHLMEGSLGIADPFVYGARVGLAFGWLATAIHRGSLLGATLPATDTIRRLLRRESSGLRLVGEVDWPAVMLLALYAERHLNSSEAEALLELWVRSIVRLNRPGRRGIPSPYWLHERVIALANGMLAPNEEESFHGHTYTLPAALDMLARRLRRQLVAREWPAASRLAWCDFCPDQPADYFRWHVETGALTTTHPTPTARWAEWRERASWIAENDVPAVLRRHPEWLAPFLMTYPHRANRTLSAFADAGFSGRVRVLSTSTAAPTARPSRVEGQEVHAAAGSSE